MVSRVSPRTIAQQPEGLRVAHALPEQREEEQAGRGEHRLGTDLGPSPGSSSWLRTASRPQCSVARISARTEGGTGSGSAGPCRLLSADAVVHGSPAAPRAAGLSRCPCADPPVLHLGPPGAAVARRAVDPALVGEVLEVAARGDPGGADAAPASAGGEAAGRARSTATTAPRGPALRPLGSASPAAGRAARRSAGPPRPARRRRAAREPRAVVGVLLELPRSAANANGLSRYCTMPSDTARGPPPGRGPRSPRSRRPGGRRRASPQDVEAVAVGQVHVEQHQVDRGVGGEQPQRLAGRRARPRPPRSRARRRRRPRAPRRRPARPRPRAPGRRHGVAVRAPVRRTAYADREPRAAERRVGDARRVPPCRRHDLPDQRQPEAAAGLAAAWSTSRARGTARGRRARARDRCRRPRRAGRRRRRRRDPHPLRRRRRVAATASTALSTRLPSTVTRSRAATGSSAGSAAGDLAGSTPRSAACADLPSSSAATHRLVDGRRRAVGERLGDAQLGGREADRLLGAAQLDQRDHGVQPVGRLVGLRAQRLGEPAGGSSSPVRRCSSVRSRRVTTRADLGLVPVGRRRLNDQHRSPSDVGLVGQRPCAARRPRPARGAGRGRRAGGPPTSAGRPSSRAASSLTQLDPAVGVDEQQALAHRVQHGVVVLVHPGDLGCPRPWVWRRSRRAISQRAQQADEQHAPAGERDRRAARARSWRVDPVDGDADRDQRHHLAAVVHDRDDRAHRRAERAGVRLGEASPSGAPPTVAEELPADLRRGPGGSSGCRSGAMTTTKSVPVSTPTSLGVRLERCATGRRASTASRDGGGVGDRRAPPRVACVARRSSRASRRASSAASADRGDHEHDDDARPGAAASGGRRALAAAAAAAHAAHCAARTAAEA